MKQSKFSASIPYRYYEEENELWWWFNLMTKRLDDLITKWPQTIPNQRKLCESVLKKQEKMDNGKTLTFSKHLLHSRHHVGTLWRLSFMMASHQSTKDGVCSWILTFILKHNLICIFLYYRDV